MSQLDFFRATTPVALSVLAARGNVALPEGADATRLFWAAAALDHAGAGSVAVFVDGGDPEDLAATQAGACFVAPADVAKVPSHTVALVSDQPLRAFARVAALLHPSSITPGPVFTRSGVDPAAIIHREANLEQGVIIDPGAVVGPGAEIGTGTTIGANSVVGAGVRIGRGCAIDSHVSIRTALIGDRVVIHAGARIGLAGPRRDAEERGRAPLSRLGRVIIQDDVEIGANAAVERGTFCDTMIGEGTCIGTLVVVPSGTVIGRHERR